VTKRWQSSALLRLENKVSSIRRIDETAGNKELSMQKKYIVRLTDHERNELLEIVKELKEIGQEVRCAQLPLNADVDGPSWRYQQIAGAFSCRARTVKNVRSAWS
jgi:hypothetical protein